MSKKDYSDIINLPHFEPKFHPRMSLQNRAAQFSPFAALRGYEEAISDKQKISFSKVELDNQQAQILNEKINRVIEEIPQKKIVSICYYDSKNKIYNQVEGIIKKIDKDNNFFIFESGEKIFIDEIWEVFD